MAAIDGKILLTKNDCYKAYQRMTPKGIVVHSTGANNPNLRRYIAPDDGVIGKNLYNNDWNRGGLDVAVHGFIGLDKTTMLNSIKHCLLIFAVGALLTVIEVLITMTRLISSLKCAKMI